MLKAPSNWKNKKESSRSPLDISALFDQARQLESLQARIEREHKALSDRLNATIEDAERAIAHATAVRKGEKGDRGTDGITPVKGVDYFDGVAGAPGAHGKDGKDGLHGTDAIIDHDVLAITMVGHIKEKKLLKKSDIDGLDSEIASVRNHVALSGKQYGKDTWARGGGDTVVAGAGVTIVANSNGTKTVSAPSAGGLNYLAATGVIDNSNTTFTFASTPTLVVVNGNTYRNGHGVTITGTTAVLDNPAGNGGDVYGLG